MIFKKKKVLLIITVFSIGGATETVLALASGLKNIGYDVDILTGPHITSEGSMDEYAKQLGIRVIKVKTLIRNINPLKDIRSLITIYKRIKNEKYEIVHTHSSKAGILGRLAAHFSRIPVVVHTIHGLPFHNYQFPLIRWLYKFIERFAARISNGIISVSYSIMQQSLDERIGQKHQFEMIRSAFDVHQYSYAINKRSHVREKYNISEEDIVAGTISRLSQLKGHDFIIDVARKICDVYPHHKFLFIGDGILRSYLERKVQNFGLSNNIIFTGLISPSEIPEHIAAVDYIIHPSLREGLARVLSQAVLLRKKAITFDIDGVREVIIEGETGYLIPPKNLHFLMDICLRICSNPNQMLYVDPKYSQLIAEEFCIETMVEKTHNFYLRFLV